MKTRCQTIVLMIPTLQGGGAERVVLNLANGLINAGHNVHIVLTLKNIIEHNYQSQIKIHFFRQYYRWIPKILRGRILAPLLDRFICNNCGKPDLVLSNLEPSDLVMCFSKLNTFLVVHNTPSKEYSNLTRFKGIYTKKPVICVSQGVKDDFDNICSSRFPVHCIHNAVDKEWLENQANEYKPEYFDYIVHVGSFKKPKRHDILLKAYAQSGISTPLVLVGKGPLEDSMKVLATELGIINKVIFVGFQANPYPLIKHAKFMVLSSDFEGFGLVIAEALALGTVVISTDCPSGPSELLPEGNLAPVGNVDMLSDKISECDCNQSFYQHPLSHQFVLENQVNQFIELIT